MNHNINSVERYPQELFNFQHVNEDSVFQVS